MKYGIALLALLVCVTPVLADEFCDGYERGYKLGYMKASGSGLEPLPPLCPLQPMKKFSDPDSDYEHGFMIGVQDGMARGFQ